MPRNKLTLYLLATIAPVTLLLIALATAWSVQQYHQIEQQTTSWQSATLDTQQQLLQQQVGNVIDYIEFERLQREQQLQQHMQARVDNSYQLIDTVYQVLHSKESTEQLQQLMTEVLNTYYDERDDNQHDFLLTAAGKILAEGGTPHLQGQCTLHFQKRTATGVENVITRCQCAGNWPGEAQTCGPIDAAEAVSSTAFAQAIANLARDYGEGFIDFSHLSEQDNGDDFHYIGFVRYFAPLDIIIGAGQYFDSAEYGAKRHIAAALADMHHEKEMHAVFIHSYDGVVLVNTADPESLGADFADIYAAHGINIHQQHINAIAEPGGDFVYYQRLDEHDHETAPVTYMDFVYAYPHWQWIIGSQVPLDEWTEQRESLNKQLAVTNYRSIFYLFAAIAAALILTAFVIRWVVIRMTEDR